MPARLLALLLILAGLIAGQPAAFAQDTGGRALRILHIMSFNSPYRWTDGQFEGFKAGLGRGVNASYQVFQLDTKRQSSPDEQERNAREARRLIDTWKPDLVYTSDDDAVRLVTRNYVNKPLPFVFSGVNLSARDHGIEGASNITGVLEREHIIESVHLLQAMLPEARRIQVLSDSAAYWPQVIGRIRTLARTSPDFQLVGVDQPPAYADFQRLVLENPNKADAYLILGNFNFKDAAGKDVPYPALQRWLAEHSKVPDISFWEDRVFYGTLAGVTVSAFEQGMAAGKLAREILVNHHSPASLPIQATTKGVPFINLERARALGITPRSSLLLSSQVVTGYEWNK